MKALGIRHWRAFGLLIATLTLSALASTAQTPAAPRYASGNIDHPDRVDIALVLAVDVSSSIESSERRFQREAYAQALRDPRVARMALGGPSGRIAIAYMEWSGRRFQRVLVPMRVMRTPAEMEAFALDILAITDRTSDPMFAQPTALGDALLAAEGAMSQLQVPARDYIIDISGDGVLNDGLEIQTARNHVLSLGLTVNGLPIEVSAGATNHGGGLDHVAAFYMDCVIGGPGSFHLVARGFADVRETLIMKLMLEMAQMDPEQKSRIASAWNGGEIGNVARIIPAMVIDLAQPQAPSRPTSNCGRLGGPAFIP